MKTGVLVHGFHLQAENWENIVWGKPPFWLGRVPKGVLVALEEKADIMVFGTGASEKDGKKEAEYTKDYLLEYFSKLANFSAFSGINLAKAKKTIEEVIRTEVRSQNTAQEIQFAGKIFDGVGVERIILVSSPVHIPRCLRDALAILKEREILVKYSQTSWSDPGETVIIEPPHGMDKLKINLYGFVKNLFAMSKEKQEEIIKKALAQ